MEVKKNKIIAQYHKSTVTGLLGKNGEEKIAVLEAMGLDASLFKIGCVSNQYQHRKAEFEKEKLAKEGVLIEVDGNNKTGGKSYKCFGSHGFVIPLYDSVGDMVNLCTFYPNPEWENEFLNKKGVFPKEPKESTKRLFILSDVISTASLIQSDALGNREAAISLFDGEVLDQHFEMIGDLPNLKELVFIGVDTEVMDEFKIRFPELKLFKVELPFGESMNDMLLTYGSGIEGYIDEHVTPLLAEKSRVSELIAINPQLHEFNSSIGLFKLFGPLLTSFGELHISVKFEENPTYNFNASIHSKVNNFKGWIISRTGLDASIVNQAIDEMVAALESKVETALRNYYESAFQPKVQLSRKEREKAEKTLKESESVLEMINNLLGETGIVGDHKARILAFVVACSYKFKYQLHAIIQGSSGSGKSHLLKTILKCLPDEDVLDLTSISSKSINNSVNNQLHKKFVGLEDVSGVPGSAMYSVRESQTNDTYNHLTVETNIFGQKESVVKSSKTDFSSIMTTTRTNLVYDNLSRSILIGVDESQEQTNRITEYNNKTYRGEVDYNKQDAIRQSISNMVRVLDSYEVVNPFAGKVILPREADSYRRLNTQFNFVINVITLLNQFNRRKDRSGRLIAELEDVRLAVEIFFGCIKLKMDNLASSQRTFYEELKFHFPKDNAKEPTFTRKEVESKLKRKKSICSQHLTDLVSLGYLTATGHANRGFKYQFADRDDFKSLGEKTYKELIHQLDATAA